MKHKYQGSVIGSLAKILTIVRTFQQKKNLTLNGRKVEFEFEVEELDKYSTHNKIAVHMMRTGDMYCREEVLGVKTFRILSEVQLHKYKDLYKLTIKRKIV